MNGRNSFSITSRLGLLLAPPDVVLTGYYEGDASFYEPKHFKALAAAHDSLDSVHAGLAIHAPLHQFPCSTAMGAYRTARISDYPTPCSDDAVVTIFCGTVCCGSDSLSLSSWTL